MSDYLQMPWSIEDTIENLEILKIAFQTKAIDIDLDGLGKQDAEEVAFDFDRAINALEENQQYRGLCKPEEIEHLKSLVRIIRHHGTIGMALEACAKYEGIGTPEECWEAMGQLKKYEDVGLTPDQIRQVDELYREKCEEVNRLKAELAEERQKHRWIPVEKGKEPPADGGYLCTLNEELCGQEEPFTGMCWIENGVWDETGMVIAYQEMPEPYQPEKGGAIHET